MALYLPPDAKAAAKSNFERAVGENAVNRRDFMKGLLAAGAVLPVSAAAYYGYTKLHGKPVRTGLIGAGDEGGVLVGEHNKDYLEFIAYSDIRPYNQKRIFEGEAKPANPALPWRKGFNRIYGTGAKEKIRLYENYKELLENKDIEAVVIALPLHLHAQVAIDAMKAGKHVLCEKLMGWNIKQCKEMIKVADETDRVLAIGHQRHYSLLYAHAVEVMRSGEIGDVKHIRALWHRNNAKPQLDANGKPIIGSDGRPVYRDGWHPPIPEEDRKALADRIRSVGYKSIEELVRWRLFNRTGAGLMAELGSHQLDACSIFLGKVHPLAVSGVGGKFFYHDERESDDHVFVTFEFPGPNYYKDKERTTVNDASDIVVVTYSSINTNSFEPYGETVMGSRGALITSMEQEIMLIPEPGTSAVAAKDKPTSVSVSTTGGGKPALESSGSTAAVVDPSKLGQAALAGPVSRGYTEEMEHFAYCVRMWEQGMSKSDRPMPRCHGRVAMADAIIALTANQSMKKRQRIEFKHEWFEARSPDVPDADMTPEQIA